MTKNSAKSVAVVYPEFASCNILFLFGLQLLSISLKILKQNIFNLKLENRSIVFDYSAYNLKEVNLDDRIFNIIFLDPPFKDRKIKSLIDQIKKLKVADENSLLVIHRNKKSEDNISQYLNVIDEKNYGLSKIFFCKLI